MKYLQSTIDLPLVLSTDGSGKLRWHIDASYAVHMDMRSHTGGAMMLGKGSVYSTLVKQKLVTRSSTEAEVVAVHDVMPQMLFVDSILLEGPRGTCACFDSLSGQNECHTLREEWMCFRQ
jgi:hypothetical protein